MWTPVVGAPCDGVAQRLWEAAVSLPFPLELAGGDHTCAVEVTVTVGVAAIGVHANDTVLSEMLLEASPEARRSVLIPFFAERTIEHRVVVRNARPAPLQTTVHAVRLAPFEPTLEAAGWHDAVRSRPAGMVHDAPYEGTLAEWLARSELEPRSLDPTRRFARLRRIVELAFRECPGYREHWTRAGWHPSDLRSLADVHDIPPISKASLRENVAAYTLPRRHLRPITTSGTGGAPLRFHYSRALEAAHTATMRLLLGPGWRGATVMTAATSMTPALVRLGHSGTLRVGARLRNDPALLARVISAVRPDVLYGWSSLVGPLVDVVAERTSHRFSRIALASERVLPSQIESMSRTAQTVAVSYGTSEGVALSLRCPHCGHYVEHPGLGVVTLRRRADGLLDVLGTSLCALGTLFIAYEVDDVAVPATSEAADCPGCTADGRARFADVVGRAQESIPVPGGAVSVLPLYVSLSRRLPGWEDVVRFDFVWSPREPGRATLRYETRSGRALDEARAKATMALDAPELDVVVQQVPGLSSASASALDGKWRLVKSMP